jgi:hypothetical protein
MGRTHRSLRPVGLSGWLVELDSSFEAASLFRYLSRRRRDGELPGQTELVPGAQTLLLHGPRPAVPTPRTPPR